MNLEIKEFPQSHLKETTNFELEKRVLLQTVDFLWRSHLAIS